MPDIEYRWLQGKDLDLLEPTMAERGWTALNPNTARAIAAFDKSNGDRLVGFLVLQLFPHLEPMFVEKELRGHQGGEIALSLLAHMREFLDEIKIRGFMCVADSAVIEGLCKERGMRKVDSPVYVL
jgi:hypothetical protein